MQRSLSENSYWHLLHFARKVDGARVENIIQSEKNTMSTSVITSYVTMEKFSCSLDVSNAPSPYGRHYFGLSICTPPDYFNYFFVFFGL